MSFQRCFECRGKKVVLEDARTKILNLFLSFSHIVCRLLFSSPTDQCCKWKKENKTRLGITNFLPKSRPILRPQSSERHKKHRNTICKMLSVITCHLNLKGYLGGCLEGVWWVCLWGGGGVSEDIWRVLGVSLSGCILSSLWECLQKCHSRKYFSKKFWNFQGLLEIPTSCSCGALQSP